MKFLTPDKYPVIAAATSVVIGAGLLMASVSNWYLFGGGAALVFLGYFVHHHLPEAVQAVDTIRKEMTPPDDPTDLPPGASDKPDNVIKIG